jgi:hypothetical protein
VFLVCPRSGVILTGAALPADQGNLAFYTQQNFYGKMAEK